MAVVYTGVGIAAGLVGEGLAASLQKPWVLVLFGAALVALAVSMSGVCERRLPGAFSQRLAMPGGGCAASVFTMGGVSALLVGPCVVAPLAGALVYLSQTRDEALGGTALFSLAAGMSVPLLLLGASAGAWLPKLGPWMERVKRFFGVLLLGVALWTVQTVLPAAIGLALWGGLAIFAALLVWAPSGSQRPEPAGRLWRVPAAGALVVLSVAEWVGAASGGVDPLQPLAHLGAGASDAARRGPPRFQAVRSVAPLDAALKTAGRPVMLDFYADWCVSCKEMERFTFSDPDVPKRIEAALLLKADVTANNPQDRALLRRFQLFGPPGTIFFGPQGQDLTGARVIGYQNRTRFAQTLDSVGL